MEVLNRGREEQTENLLQFLNRDDGFQSESLNDMDETLKSVHKIEVGFPEENENPSEPSASEAPQVSV
ncbi:MAG: hypothetical protein JWQ35_1636 [Bacteriovoracaceae bacterium]|nr:hypothetical protein [Bacteriovoracaceae bacterium]